MSEITQRELRGIPFVGGRRSSAIPGTDPLPAVIAKDERGKLHRPDPQPGPFPRGILAVHYERSSAPHVTRATRESGRFFPGR